MCSFFLRVFVISISLANVSNTADILNKTLDVSIPIDGANAKTLLELGEKSNSPILKLIGFALRNLKCEINGQCDNWSPWTHRSSITKATFGLRTRMRSCYQTKNKNECGDLSGEKTVENQNEVCEGFCPMDYNFTDTNLCLKTRKAPIKHHAAEQFCEEDGGHIINIDTQERFEVASSVANTNFIWAQGKRTEQAGPWQYTNGGDPESQPFFKWHAGEPTNSANSLYMVLHSSKFYDTPDSSRMVICEIRQ